MQSAVNDRPTGTPVVRVPVFPGPGLYGPSTSEDQDLNN